MDLTPVFRLEYFIVAAASGTPCDLEPIFNEEKYLHSIAGASVDLPMPIGRTQEYLAKLAGMDVEIPDKPIFRTEYYLAHMIDDTIECPAPIFREEMFYYEWAAVDYETAGPAAIVNFTTQRAAPLKSLLVSMSPVQDLHGYDSPWPAGGGKNKFDVSKVESYTDTYGGTISQSNGTISVTTSTGSSNVRCGKTLGQLAPLLTVGETYILTGDSTATSANQIYLPAVSTLWKFGDPLTITQEALASEVAFYASGTNASATITQVMIRLSSVSDATYSPYSNICPISGFTGVNVWVKEEYDTSLPATVSVTFPDSVGTVYLGTLDVVTGDGEIDYKLINARDVVWKWSSPVVYCTPSDLYKTVTTETPTGRKQMWCNIAPYNNQSSSLAGYIAYGGATNNGNIVYRDSAIAPDLATWQTYISNNDVFICYPLATPIPIQLTPQEVLALVGENNVWSNSDTVTVEYRSN